MVEGGIARLSRWYRRVPCGGVASNYDWLHMRLAGINLRALLKLGLISTDSPWLGVDRLTVPHYWAMSMGRLWSRRLA